MISLLVALTVKHVVNETTMSRAFAKYLCAQARASGGIAFVLNHGIVSIKTLKNVGIKSELVSSTNCEITYHIVSTGQCSSSKISIAANVAFSKNNLDCRGSQKQIINWQQ